MHPTSIIFILVFAIPLFIALFWLMKKDKKQGKFGFVIVILILLIAIYVILTKVPTYDDLFPPQ